MARDKQCQCHEDESAPHVGHGHDPASLVAVSERAGRQREHEPRERVGRRDRRHRKRVRVHEESKEGNGSVAEAVAEARYDKGRPEIAEPSPERSTSPRRRPTAVLTVLAALLEGHGCIIARICHSRWDDRAATDRAVVHTTRREWCPLSPG